ncbi:MAG: choice-of-anchor J domain-containing protein [Bacteroidota bacterium]
MKATLLFTLFGALLFWCMTPAMANYPFTEDFEGSEDIPAGWTVYNQSGDMTWEITDLINNTPDGSNSAFHNFAFGMQDTWLTTPQISMPDEGDFFLNFWQINMDTDFYHKNSVMVSAGSPDPDDGDYVEVWTEDIVPDEWSPVYIDLEDYAGEDIYIAFRYEGDNAHIWIIDDVALGEEVDIDPEMVVDAEEIEQSVAQNGTSTNRFSIINEGIGTLDYDIVVDYVDEDGWLTVDPASGTVAGNSSEFIDLTFSDSGYDFGSYEATITITGNDTENPEATVDVIMNVMDASPVNLVVFQDTHTFPVAISENGQHVVGTPFGGETGYYWSEESGVTNIAAAVEGVSDDGEVVVTYEDPDLIYNDNPVTVAGKWSLATGEFEFLGMNPAAPEFFMNDYSSGYGISADGSTIVGMQYYQGFNYKAFSWSEDDYDNIGDHADLPEGNRPNGITANGEVVYGWAQTATASRSPVVWHNDEIIFIDETSSGEAYGGSPNGQFITGELNSEGFVLNTETGEITTFQNTLNDGMIGPAAVSNDGYVFGFTAEGFPPLPGSRRAFVRHPDGNLTTFNDYAVDQGWFDAESWTFYAITGVSGDGNRLIGAGMDKDGNDVSFMVDLAPAEPEIEADPMSLTESLEHGETAEQIITISNTGTGDLNYQATIQFVEDEARVQEVPAGRTAFNRDMELAVKKETHGFHPATRIGDKDDVVLNYDGANVDAIGLLDGGTFYGAARYPSSMVAPFGGYLLESVDVYVGNIPTEIKLMIWDAGTTTSPGDLLHEQEFTPTEASWNTVILNEALPVSGADLWVGLMITHDAGSYVLGIDGGPDNMDANWLTQDINEWEHLSDYGVTGNWNIRTKLQYDGIQWLSLDPVSGTIEEGENQQVTLGFNAEELEPGTYEANIRLNSNAVNDELVIVPVTLEVADLPLYTLTLLIDPEDAGEVIGAGEYYAGDVVTVNALANDDFAFLNWTDQNDEVVSAEPENDISMPAEHTTLTANFESTVSVQGITENSISIYPNPASTYFHITGDEKIETVALYDLSGQLVYEEQINQTTGRIHTSDLQEGIYLVRIIKANEVFTKKVRIIR